MKNHIFIGLSTAFLACLLVSACTKDFEQINTDPNRPATVTTTSLLTSVEKEMMDDTWDEWQNGRFGMLYAQFWAETNYNEESRYQPRESLTNSYWADYYSGSGNGSTRTAGGGLQNLNEIIRICTETPAIASAYGDVNNQIAVAKTLKVWMLQTMTDIWGNIPYSQANTGNTTPKFDTQRDIYLGLLAEINGAIAKFDATKAGFSAGDIIYGGDVAHWQKFANSVKLRLAMRMADREPALAKTAVQEAVTAGVFANNSDDALFQYGTNEPSDNPLHYNYYSQGRRDFACSKVFVDTLNSLADPRLPAFAQPLANTTATFAGSAYGHANGKFEGASKISYPGLITIKADAQGIFMNYAEVEFFLAEAVERGFIATGSAESHYNAGITASMTYWGASATDAAAYLANPKVAYGSVAGTWQQKIGFQKWIALYMQGIEAWAEWRRLDFGVLQLPVAGALPTARIDPNKLPARLTYPLDEVTLNGTNTAAAVAAQGPDRLDTKLWWDVN